MLELVDLRAFTGDLATALAPPESPTAPLEDVRAIIADVRARGDAAVREYAARFDGCTIDDLRVPRETIDAGSARVPADVRAALEYAAGEIRAYHEAQPTATVRVDRDGIQAEERLVPVDRAGCYAPGGRASYPSTVLMTAIPARVAGVADVALCVPPDPDGTLPDVTLAAAALAGVDEVYRVGGVPAIAALAYGTETVRPVDVIVGPGNVYVTLAKREVLGQVGTDTFAGPSELVVVADATADADLVAADLLAQAEHGPGGAAVLVTWHEPLIAAVEAALSDRVDAAPRATDIRATLATGGRAVLVNDAAGALAVANTIAPEHLELHTADPDALVSEVRNAGAVFCGAATPAAVGDYVAGVSHVLPTGRTARFASALRVDTFRKHIHVVHAAPAALERVAPYVAALAAAEGLPEHARSVTMRTGRGVAAEQAS